LAVSYGDVKVNQIFGLRPLDVKDFAHMILDPRLGNDREIEQREEVRKVGFEKTTHPHLAVVSHWLP
jgi:hypothetical protein